MSLEVERHLILRHSNNREGMNMEVIQEIKTAKEIDQLSTEQKIEYIESIRVAIRELREEIDYVIGILEE